ncbi:hypothetical protein [Desulfuromonas versatilis]|uniref:hypothetical protein n=1 Tax=Desulfuromonas versatilis TaxID=2802975 RepID=UPI001C849C8C|nr:hypothetical protein [Desulfuromonas versatilis]
MALLQLFSHYFLYGNSSWVGRLPLWQPGGRQESVDRPPACRMRVRKYLLSLLQKTIFRLLKG